MTSSPSIGTSYGQKIQAAGAKTPGVRRRGVQAAASAKVFGAAPFHPGQLRQSYFFQDNWKLTPTLALALGLRYEKPGQPADSLPYPTFPGFDPSQFLVRHEVHRDDLDFGPAVGLAWSPSLRSGLLARLLGEGKTAFRGGYQISYDSISDLVGGIAQSPKAVPH
jgi:outer membrane receptor protein involved in Fe transport